MMAEFPLDPQLAKMMVAAPEYRCPARATRDSAPAVTLAAMPYSLSAGPTLCTPGL